MSTITAGRIPDNDLIRGRSAAAEFIAEYGARVREAYPARSYGTVLPFRRVFVVARKP